MNVLLPFLDEADPVKADLEAYYYAVGVLSTDDMSTALQVSLTY